VIGLFFNFSVYGARSGAALPSATLTFHRVGANGHTGGIQRASGPVPSTAPPVASSCRSRIVVWIAGVHRAQPRCRRNRHLHRGRLTEQAATEDDLGSRWIGNPEPQYQAVPRGTVLTPRGPHGGARKTSHEVIELGHAPGRGSSLKPCPRRPQRPRQMHSDASAGDSGGRHAHRRPRTQQRGQSNQIYEGSARPNK